MTATTEYLAVLKASYDYEKQSDDEVSIKEDHIVFLVERTDDEWWKVKVKQDGLEDKGPVGLVPASYLEDATPISTVKALYDYDAAAPGELTIKEDEELLVYEKEDEWILVKKKTQDKVGYVPANYCDEAGEGAQEEEDEPATPPRPVSNYVDPAALVAASSPAKGKGDDVQTWSVSEVDAKNKKKKGTLGVGKGSIFFASESDKTPVQKWDTQDIASVKTEKSKHIHIEIEGDKATSLHFHASSSKEADAIVKKLESSKALATTLSPPTSPTVEQARSPGIVHSLPPPPPLAVDIPEQKPKNNHSVHFRDSPNSIIPPPEDTLEGSDAGSQDEEGEGSSALYDFGADGDDELSVREGEKLRVLDRSNDEWWKCRNVYGAEGVVPASYIELDAGEGATAVARRADSDDDDDAQRAAEAEAEAEAAREAEERAEAERKEQERKKKQEAERKAKAAAAAAAAERQRKADEEREKARQDKARREAEANAKQEEQEEERAQRAATAKKAAVAESRPSTSSQSSSRRQSRPSEEKRRKPSPSKVRTWHDRTGQFQVDAEFLGFNNGLLRLHKTNGVIIEVPSEKMSAEDMAFIDKQRRKAAAAAAAAAQQPDDGDDVPLGALPAAQGKAKLGPTAQKALPQPKKGPSTDWFEFFLNAGCDIDDCTRYAASFERDKMDEAILPDIKESTLRSLGLREGDIIRVTKVIEQRRVKHRQSQKPEVQRQLRSDEELARHLQAEEDAGIAQAPSPPTAKRSNTTSPAPNLFAGPDGVLKPSRRGRPPTSKTAPPSSVDVNAIGNGNVPEPSPSPALSPPPRVTTSPSPVVPPKTVGGFDDDAWTVRPSKSPAPPPAQPPPPAPAMYAAPPAPTPPPPPPAPAAPAPASLYPPAPAMQRPASTNPTGSSQDEITRRLLDKIDSYRPPSAPVPPTVQPVAISPPPSIITPPIGYQSGMGLGSSPVPIGQALQQQQTGFLPSPGLRGPLAPVPQNQGLLQPLVPTSTGFNGFVPARPASNPTPSFQSQSPFQNPSPFQTSPFQNPSGFNSQALLPQATGFPMSASPIQFQQTGMPQGALNSFGTPSAFGSPFAGGVQTNPTGFNPSFNTGFSAPPPVPPLPASVSPANAAPANIFASMKAGTFASDDSAPQSSDKYDALRQPNGLAAQPTGWQMNGYQTNGFQTYGFQQR